MPKKSSDSTVQSVSLEALIKEPMLPSLFNQTKMEEWSSLLEAQNFNFLFKSNERKLEGEALVKDLLAKSISIPTMTLPQSKLVGLADQQQSGIIEWPDFEPGTLKQIAYKHVGAQLILGSRVDDVRKYSKLSSHYWKPGWHIQSRVPLETSRNDENRKIRQAERFLETGTLEELPLYERTRKGLYGIESFLAQEVRSFLIYDTLCAHLQRDRNDRVLSFKPLDPGSIKLIDPLVGYFNNKEVQAIQDSMQRAHILAGDDKPKTYTYKELAWMVGNPRSYLEVGGYGFSRMGIAFQLIQGFTNIILMNLSSFDANSIPPGILTITGSYSQKIIDVLNRIWTNARMGNNKDWMFPAIGVPQGGELKLLDLSGIKGKEVYYKDWMNMVAGVLCAIFNFPIARFGYKASGMNRDENRKGAAQWLDTEDTGQTVLLERLASFINEYLIWPNWPQLVFSFTGSSPKEDAREFELRSLAMTVGERRALVGLPPLKDLKVESNEYEDEVNLLKELLNLVPVDTGIVGPYQSLVTSIFRQQGSSRGGPAGGGQAALPGSKFDAPKDPVAQAEHGHEPGIRRRAQRGETSSAE